MNATRNSTATMISMIARMAVPRPRTRMMPSTSARIPAATAMMVRREIMESPSIE
jgi:hypothetical protein